MAIAGRVAIVPKGDWSADATYKRLDAVTYNNTLYFAKKEVPAGTATSNTEYWSKSIVGGASAIATTEDAGVVKPDGKSMIVDESGTLSINLDGTTITLDEAKNVIKLADTLKDKIGSALQPESIVNNQITTEAGFALDARQANPNIDGTLAKQVADLNGSLEIQGGKGCTLVNATGSASYIRNGFMAQVIMEITPTKLENGAILLKGLPRPQNFIYMTLPAINGNNIPCVINANGELSIYYQDGGNSISRIDHIFCYMCI
jgi:hypothetical protein